MAYLSLFVSCGITFRAWGQGIGIIIKYNLLPTYSTNISAFT